MPRKTRTPGLNFKELNYAITYNSFRLMPGSLCKRAKKTRSIPNAGTIDESKVLGQEQLRIDDHIVR